jgi:hypothetical protein
MTTTRQNIATLLWTIPILIVCGLIVYFDSSLNTCYGLVHGLGDLFLMLVLLILSLFFIVRQIYKIAGRADNKKTRILASLIVIVAITIAFQGKSTWKEIRLGKSILKASIYPDQLDIGRLELIDEEKYYALYGHIDWSCTYTDKYEMKGDTLILGGNPFEKTDGILTDKYIMTDSTLIPVKFQDIEMKRTEILTIEKKK